MKTETTISQRGIKVTVHIPEVGDIPEYIREQKINQIYDILAPKARKSNGKSDIKI